MKKVLLVAFLLILGVSVMPATAAAQTENCLQMVSFPVLVELCHDGNIIEYVDDGFGGLWPVYQIDTVKFENLTGSPWRFTAEDGEGNGWTSTITPGEGGERKIPPPQQYRSFPITFSLTLIRN